MSAKEYWKKEFHGNMFNNPEKGRILQHSTIEDVKGLIDESIPKITDECYNIEDGFKHYGIDCKLGREKLMTELKKLKI